MKDYLKQLLETTPSSSPLARCLVAEYLQARILECLQENGAFTCWAFIGGTALRFLYRQPRFSEDLNFSLTQAGADDHFSLLMEKIQSSLSAEGYRLTIKAKTDKTVKSAFIRFEGLLYELGLSGHGNEITSVKVEIDTNPPAGATFQTSLVRKHLLLNLLHYDKSSLLAGKLHALLCRSWVKGRDVYDLMWYLSDQSWPPPNLDLLNHALIQTRWPGEPTTSANWKNLVAGALTKFDWNQVVADVQPFIEKQQELAMLTRENLLQLLSNQ